MALEFISQFSSLQDIIAWGGLILLFAIVFAETGLLIGFFLPGDSLLFTAGLLAAAGMFDIRILILTLITAAIIGDTVGYWTGRFMGQRLFRKKDSRIFKQEYVRRAHAFYEKYGAKTIMLARWVPIIRTFAPIVAGVATMDYRKFLTYNIIGGIVWVTTLCLAGYYLVQFIPGIADYLHYVIALIIVLSVLPIVHDYWKSRRSKTAA